jgi:uncharacterized lipoprotein YddW (UPF0748 family)
LRKELKMFGRHSLSKAPLAQLPALILTLLGALLLLSCSSETSSSDELRQHSVDRAVAADSSLRKGIWLTHVGSSVFQSRANLESALVNIKRAGFNTVYPVIWNKGYTTFPSESLRTFAGVSIDPQFQGRDPLREIIEINESRQLGLKVIPWFEYGLKVVFGAARNPSQPDPRDLVSLNPIAKSARDRGLLLRRNNGSEMWFDSGNGHFFGFFNPLSQPVRDLLNGIAKEVTSRYNVAGFQIDDHFSMHAEFGYNPELRQAYSSYLRQKNLSQYDLGISYPVGSREAEVQKKMWSSWRADQVIDAARELGRNVPANSSNFVYQISPAGEIGFSFGRWLQNWRSLVHDRIAGEFAVQVYREDMASFTRLIDDDSIRVSRTRAVASIGIFAGYKGKPRPTTLLVNQVRAAFSRGMGVNFFFYDTLFTGDQSRIEAITKALNESP